LGVGVPDFRRRVQFVSMLKPTDENEPELAASLKAITQVKAMLEARPDTSIEWPEGELPEQEPRSAENDDTVFINEFDSPDTEYVDADVDAYVDFLRGQHHHRLTLRPAAAVSRRSDGLAGRSRPAIHGSALYILGGDRTDGMKQKLFFVDALTGSIDSRRATTEICNFNCNVSVGPTSVVYIADGNRIYRVN
jgi:hypothetical protein